MKDFRIIVILCLLMIGTFILVTQFSGFNIGKTISDVLMGGVFSYMGGASGETCSCTAWTNAGCGKNVCQGNQMYQTRTCSPSGCGTVATCVASTSCTQTITSRTTATPPLVSTTTTPTPLFSYSNFNCNSDSKICSMSYSNNAGEPVVIVLYLLDGQELKQQSAGRVAVGSSTFNAPPFSCGPLSLGEYKILFQVFRDSDTTYQNPILSPTESKTVSCTEP